MKQKYFSMRLMLFIIISLFVFNVSTVSAVPVQGSGSGGTSVCMYGIVCAYKNVSSGVSGGASTINMTVAYKCNDSTSISSCTELAVWTLQTGSSISKTIVDETSLFLPMFKEEGGYVCPENLGDDYEFVCLSANASDEEIEEIVEEMHNPTTDDDTSGIIEKIVAWGSSTLGLDYDLESDSCSLISAEVREFLGDIFSYMSIIGIVILVIMTGINVVKVITASEDDALKGFLKNLWKRIVCLIILLLLPMLVTFIIQVVNGVADIWGVNSDDPLCSITE